LLIACVGDTLALMASECALRDGCGFSSYALAGLCG